jgi:hypothetical protein
LSHYHPLVVCVAAYDEATCFPELLACLQASSLWAKVPSRHIFVGLNGCTDNSVEVLEAHRNDQFSLTILESDKADKSTTLNELIAAAQSLSPYLVFFDAEVLPHPTALECLTDRLESDPDCDLAAAQPVASVARIRRPTWYQRCRVKYRNRPWVLQGSGETVLPRANLYAIRSGVACNLRYPEDTVICDDYFFTQTLRQRVQIEHSALVYFTPPAFADHIRQRIRHRRSLRQLKQRFEGPPPDRRNLTRIRFPRFLSPEEVLFFLLIQAEERWSRHRARVSPKVVWERISSSRPARESKERKQGLRQRLLQPVQALMVAATHHPVGHRLFSELYEWVTVLWAALTIRIPGVEACLISGSAVRGHDLFPGLSDIDTTTVLEDSDGRQERDTLLRFLRFYSPLRQVFPVLHEPVTFRKREMIAARLCGEPWLTIRVYRTYQGQSHRHWLGNNPKNRDAHLAIFVRRFLRFYTRQALARDRQGLERYVRLHPVGLTSMNRLLGWAQGSGSQECLGELDFTAEARNPASVQMKELFDCFHNLEENRFLNLDPTMGSTLASRAYIVLREIARAYGNRPGEKTFLDIEPIEEPACARYCRQLLNPLLQAIHDHRALRHFRPVLSSAGVHSWQYRLYLLSCEELDLGAIEEAYTALSDVWSRYRNEFPRENFGAFPNPCLLPREALSLLHLSYQGTFERAYLSAIRPDLGIRVAKQELDTTLFRDILERAYLVLRRLDLSTAPSRTVFRFLDTFCGLVPAICLWLEKGRLVLGASRAGQEYVNEFQDDYASFLARFELEQLWFSPAAPASKRIQEIQMEYYPVLRRRLDSIVERLTEH